MSLRINYNPNMTFKRLAEYFERLEQTSSRLTLIDILSELFLGLDAKEVPLVSYLIQGSTIRVSHSIITRRWYGNLHL